MADASDVSDVLDASDVRSDADTDAFREAAVDTPADVATDSSPEDERQDERPDAQQDERPDPIDEGDARDGPQDDAGPEVPLDGSPDEPGDEGGGDPGGDCGEGCPRNVLPDHLKLWLAADWGAACDTHTGRLTSWNDRADQTRPRTFSVGSGHVGPLCRIAEGAWAGRMVPFFDRGGTDDEGSVLPIDLGAIVNSDYTVFVVERRLSGASPSYLLGSTPPDIGTGAFCGSLANSHKAYRFGYMANSFFMAGSHSVSEDEQSCVDIGASCPSFVVDHPVANLDVEVLSANTSHLLYFGTGRSVVGDDSHVIESLLPDHQYLGRAHQPSSIDPSNPDARFYGEIAEVVIYGAALGDEDRLAVSRYLMDRWTVTNPP